MRQEISAEQHLRKLIVAEHAGVVRGRLTNRQVKDLARLSLRDPEYLAVHSEAAQPTPLRLQQAYLECGAHEKLDMLWSFIKTHLRVRPVPRHTLHAKVFAPCYFSLWQHWHLDYECMAWPASSAESDVACCVSWTASFRLLWVQVQSSFIGVSALP